NVAVHREIAFAATGGDNHVHPSEDFLVAFNAGRIQRQPGGIGADALPGFHLALIAFLWDLRVKIHRRQGMDDVRRKTLFIDVDAKGRSEEHTSELQSRFDLVCRLLLEKKKKRRKDKVELRGKATQKAITLSQDIE